MLTLISLGLAAAASAPIPAQSALIQGEPIQVQSTPARESSNKASGFGKHLDQSALIAGAMSVSTASIRPDGTLELSCKTHRPDNHELERHALERNEQEK